MVLAIIAGRIAARPADRYRTFGSFRAEILGALFNGVFLLGMAGLVFYVGILRLLDPMPVESTFMIFAAVGGLITESISLAFLYRGQKRNLNVRGAYWHVVQTFVGSLLIIVAAVIIAFTGFLQIDPILGIGFGMVLVWASVGILRESTRILMDTVPTDVDVVRVQEGLRAIRGVKDVQHVHAWALTSGKNLFSAHILIEDEATMSVCLTRPGRPSAPGSASISPRCRSRKPPPTREVRRRLTSPTIDLLMAPPASRPASMAAVS